MKAGAVVEGTQSSNLMKKKNKLTAERHFDLFLVGGIVFKSWLFVTIGKETYTSATKISWDSILTRHLKKVLNYKTDTRRYI